MDLQHLRASDGTGEAVLAHIQSVRNPGSTVLDLDNVDNWNSKAVIITGTPAANGFISPAGMKVMYGHLNAGDFIIDGYAPGYVDNGNTTSEVAIVKMTTSWADALIDLLDNSLQDNGLLKLTALDHFFKPSESVFDYIASGAVLAGLGYGANLNGSLTAGVVYINGLRNLIPSVASRTFTASKDTYVDALYNSNGTATIVYTEVSNNAASPALAANSVRVGIVVSGASSIASIAAINQGQEGKLLPIASGQAYMVTDSLGNLICPRDPNRIILGYREIYADATTAVTFTPQEIIGLRVPFIVPGNSNRKVEVELFTSGFNHSATGGYANMSVSNGSISGVANVIAGSTTQSVNGSASIVPMSAKRGGKTMPPGLATFIAGIYSITAGTTRFSAQTEGTGERTPSYLVIKRAS